MSNILELVAKDTDSGKRVDIFLSENLAGKSRSFVQKLIKEGKVKVGDKAVSKNYKLIAGDKICLDDLSLNSKKVGIKPQRINLKIVYEDKSLLVISKKAGIVTHPSPGHSENTLVNAILYYCSRLSLLAGQSRAGIVHRLDKDTSGLIIIAKNEDVHRLLSEEFKSRKVSKTYLALVWGNFTHPEGEINLPIGRSKSDRKKMSISLDRGREAITKFRVICRFDNCSLVEISPITGRTHQIRVHFSYIGHPIIGDKQYGNKDSERLAQKLGLGRQFLHAKKLVFTHPVSGKRMEIEDELEEDLDTALKKLRGEQGM